MVPVRPVEVEDSFLAGSPLVKLGIHCDVRPGYCSALQHAESLGCEAMQILPYRRHHEPTEEEFKEFKTAFAKSTVERLVIHVRFLPFLASSDPAKHRRSIELLEREIRFASALGGEFLIVHMGAYSPGSSLAEGTEIFAQGIAEAWRRQAPGSLRLVIENVPGGGRRMGGALEELASLAERLETDRVQTDFCLDTAHGWAFGEGLDSREGMDRWLTRAQTLFGADRVSIFHLNDSQAVNASNREHHWHWGKGALGTEGIDALLRNESFANALGILEMPFGNDGENMEWMRSRVRQASRLSPPST